MFSADEIADIVAHMNEDHADAVLIYARVFTEFRDITSAQMLSVDENGFDIQCSHANGSDEARIAFKEPLKDKSEIRMTLVQLVQDARAIEKSR